MIQKIIYQKLDCNDDIEIVLLISFWGCPVVWWLAPAPHSERVPGLTPGWGLSVWSLLFLPVYAWVLSGYSGFLPPSKNIHVRLIGVSKIVLRSECECVWLFVSCGPVMGWRPVQGVPRPSPNGRWDRLQPPRNPTVVGIENEWMEFLPVFTHNWTPRW